jgi:uncharacterized protein YceK
MIRNIAILSSVLYLSGCATVHTVNGQSTKSDDMVKTVAAIIVVGAIAGAVGKQNQQSKCANNRAGFWQDHSTGKIYTCP